MKKNNAPITARAVYKAKPDTEYKIYLEAEELIFIKVSGQNWNIEEGAEVVMPSPVSILSELIKWLFRNKRKKKESVEILPSEVSKQDTGGSNCFVIKKGDVAKVSLQPAETISFHGDYYVLWRLETIEGEKYNLQLERKEEIEGAINRLKIFFGDLLEITVKWNEKKGEMEK